MSSIDPFSNSRPSSLSYSEVELPILLLRHAKTKIDEMVAPSDWILDEEGHRQALRLRKDPRLQNISTIYSSPAIKAIQTVKPFAEENDIDIIEVEGLKECYLDRYYPLQEEYVLMKEAKFLDPTLDIGESHEDALQRFLGTLEGIRSYSSDHSVLIVTHGTILALYVGHINRFTPQQMIRFWKSIPFCYLEQI